MILIISVQLNTLASYDTDNMQSNLLDSGPDEILSAAIERTDGELYVVDPSAETIERLVDVASASAADSITTRLAADSRTLKGVMEDFLVASHAADLVENGVLELRTLEDDVSNSLLVSSDTVMALVDTGRRLSALASDDDRFVEDVFRAAEEVWSGSGEFALRTPPISRVRETLGAEIGPETRADFDRVLASLETARGDGTGLDEVTISLLVAAKNEVLLYDISKWGEDVGIASKATFSRTKTRLEDMGLLDTEKVPIDVGRPRLRLKVGDDRLADASGDELASVAQSLMAS